MTRSNARSSVLGSQRSAFAALRMSSQAATHVIVTATNTDVGAHRLPRRARHQHHHRRDRAGPGEHRDREREDRDVVARAALGLLLGGGARRRRLRAHHVDRHQQQHDAAGDLERAERDAERLEDQAARDARTSRASATSRTRRAQRGRAGAARRVSPRGDREEDRHVRERIDHEEHRRQRDHRELERPRLSHYPRICESRTAYRCARSVMRAGWSNTISSACSFVGSLRNDEQLAAGALDAAVARDRCLQDRGDLGARRVDPARLRAVRALRVAPALGVGVAALRASDMDPRRRTPWSVSLHHPDRRVHRARGRRLVRGDDQQDHQRCMQPRSSAQTLHARDVLPDGGDVAERRARTVAAPDAALVEPRVELGRRALAEQAAHRRDVVDSSSTGS